jgi:hypothetical protein
MPAKSSKKKVQPVRGDAIRFTRGTYVGKTGWINNARPETACSLHVVVDENQSETRDAEFLACVRKTSVAALRATSTAEEFCIQSDAKVAYHLSKLAQALAECGVAGNPDVLLIIKEHLDVAYMVQVQKGTRAKFSETALRLYKTKEHLLETMKDQAMPDASRSGGAHKKGS